VDLGAQLDRRVDIRYNAALGHQEAAIGLEHRQRLVRQPVAGEAPRYLAAREHLVRQVVLQRRLERALEDPAVGRAGVDRAGDVQQLLAYAPLDLAP
jgi:hypothetical protein